LKTLVLISPEGYAAPIAPWVAALEEARLRTLSILDGMDESLLDWQPHHGEGSIASLLYHIAAIEIDWLYSDILEGATFSRGVAQWFPYDVRNDQGQLTKVRGEDLAKHLVRLAVCRTQLLAVLKTMTVEDFQRLRTIGNYQVTPEWVLHHLLQHEAEHRGEIASIRKLAIQAG
jgi:uncharacterized damage-inducible protein DinB